MKLADIPKTSTFLRLKPDTRIPTPEAALLNKDNIIHTPRILESGAYSYTIPEDRGEYHHLSSSTPALSDLGLDSTEPETSQYQDIVSGKLYADPDFLHAVSAGSAGYPMPYAQAYAGWQFGLFAGQLGDGRVMNLFEIPKPHNIVKENRNMYELQLKGAGMTPYSRFADGKAVLRSSIREYIISEHLHAIGIPTTRALSLTYLPHTLARRQIPEKCAIVSRFAESWVRLGTFDLYRWRGDREGIKSLSDYCIKELFTTEAGKFPALTRILGARNDFFDDMDELSDYDRFYYETIIRNAESTAKWQVYGFLNGVLNTDNTSVMGLSMDYGPFSIMDKFDPNYTPNSEDHESRYGYRNTPTSMWWNLTRLGENLAELIGIGNKPVPAGITPDMEEPIIKRATKIIEIGGQVYTYTFTKLYVETFFRRLGLSPDLIDQKEPDLQNQEIIVPLLKVLQKIQCDYNKFFIQLQEVPSFNQDFAAIAKSLAPKSHDLFDQDELADIIAGWLPIYKEYLTKSGALGYDRASSKRYNPLFLPRNWILDEVIAQTEKSGGKDVLYLKQLERMSFYPFNPERWTPTTEGSVGTPENVGEQEASVGEPEDMKKVEERWLGDVGEEYSMMQCSCSS